MAIDGAAPRVTSWANEMIALSTPQGHGLALGETHHRSSGVISARLGRTGAGLAVVGRSRASAGQDDADVTVAPILSRCAGGFAELAHTIRP